MKFEINLYLVLVFIVPGIVILGDVAIFYSPIDINDLTDPKYGNKLEIILAVIVFSFFFGGLVDSLRSVIIDPIINRILKGNLPLDYISKINHKNIEVFKLLTDQTIVYYRYNANLVFSILVSIIICLFNLAEVPLLVFVGLIVLCILFFISSLKSKKVVNYVMNQFINS